MVFKELNQEKKWMTYTDQENRKEDLELSQREKYFQKEFLKEKGPWNQDPK